MISIKEVEKLAHLSRLALSDDEKKKFQDEINSILMYVEQVQKVQTALSSSPDKPLLRNVMREDENPHESEVYTKDIVREFPRKEGDYLKVKNILEK